MILLVEYGTDTDKTKFVQENTSHLGKFDGVLYVNNRSVNGAQLSIVPST
jgi:hypothetical protein